jgi:hypothetical protein
MLRVYTLPDYLSYLSSQIPLFHEIFHENNSYSCTTPMEALRSASKCNTIPEKQHDLLNNTVENNTIMKLPTYKINPTTYGWLRGTTKNDITK